MGEDEILDELHAIREALLKEAGGDLADLVQWLKRREIESGHELVSHPPRSRADDQDEAA